MLNIYGVDFGTGDALAIFGSGGLVSKRDLKLPRVKGGKTPAQEFIMIGEALLTGNEDVPAGDIVVESATLGSSGCEVGDVVDLLGRVSQSIFTVSGRAVKNYRADHPELGWKKGARYVKDGAPPPVMMELHEQVAVHVEDAEIIYRLATESPSRLYLWTGPSTSPGRVHSSVRPMDKRGYRDERSEDFMALLPPFSTLPADLRELLGNKGAKGYSRSMVMPFAMASTEPHIDAGPRDERRGRYEKVIGFYERGYPSFYRRATVVWMQENAKRMARVTRIGEVPPDVRKEAWRVTQRQVRQFFHMTMAHQGR